jgi:hypothetical protein
MRCESLVSRLNKYFLTLRKDADSDIPNLKQVKAGVR